MKKLLLLINPNAGKGGFKAGLGEVLMTFHRAGFSTTVAFTDKHGDAPRIAARAADGYDRIVCVGGDGTFSETVAGLMSAQTRPEVGYVPMGTTNDCANTLGISQAMAEAAETAAFGQSIPFDVGCFNHERYFTYVAAFGAFTEVSYQTPQDQKNALGRLAYLLDGISRLPNLTHRWARVEYDGGVLEDDYIFCGITNSRSVAGLIHLNSVGVSLSDGLFEVILVRNPENVLQVGAILTDIFANKFESEYVTLLKSRTVRVTLQEPVNWTMDGEDGGMHSEVYCENIPRAVRVLVNGEKQET